MVVESLRVHIFVEQLRGCCIFAVVAFSTRASVANVCEWFERGRGGEGYTNNKIWKHNIQYYIVSFRHIIRLSTSVRTECVLFYVFLILIFPWRFAPIVDGVFFWGGDENSTLNLFVRPKNIYKNEMFFLIIKCVLLPRDMIILPVLHNL